MYTAQIDEATFGKDSRALLRSLQAQGIQTRPLWQPIHLSAPYRHEFAARYEVAERLYRDSLSLPCSVGLTPEQQNRVLEALHCTHEADSG
jgi:perosamine synthetase